MTTSSRILEALGLDTHAGDFTYGRDAAFGSYQPALVAT